MIFLIFILFIIGMVVLYKTNNLGWIMQFFDDLKFEMEEDKKNKENVKKFFDNIKRRNNMNDEIF